MGFIDARIVYDTDGKKITDKIGVLNNLQTTDKSSLVNAINSNTTSLTQNTNILSSMRDPLAYLNSVEILCKFSARGYPIDNTVWLQGFSINEKTNEIYLAIQGAPGTTLSIQVFDLQGNFKESKSMTIESGAYSESLPFFYNANNELCFVVQTTVANTRSIYNYTKGTLGSSFVVNGGAKMSVEGNYFVTCDATVTTLKTIYVYDWSSIQSGAPTLLNSFRVESYGTALFEKTQGIVLNNGYIFVTQGASGGNPALTIYNTAGQLVNAYWYTKESVAKAVNQYYPNTLTDLSGYSYENESGWVYKGKLVTAQIINSVVYLFVHNCPDGYHLETKLPNIQNDTGWLPVTLINGAVDYAGDGTTTSRIRRIGNIVYLTGAIKGFTAMSTEYLDFGTQFAPDRNLQWTQVTSSNYQCNWQIQPNGRAKVMNTMNPSPTTSSWYPFNFVWFI